MRDAALVEPALPDHPGARADDALAHLRDLTVPAVHSPRGDGPDRPSSAARTTRRVPFTLSARALCSTPDHNNRKTVMRNSLASVLASAALLTVVSVPTHAQTSAPQAGTQASAPAELPAHSPFDIPYGMPLSLRDANRAIAAAEAEAAKHGWPEAIAVVNPDGGLVSFAKMDDTQNASPDIALRKARTAAGFRRDTRTFFNSYSHGNAYPGTLDPGLAASPGGLPLVVGGHIVGAIGCSGGTGDQDADICQAGVDALK
ncbi:GlcG/HbpS family heme-binding protein [Paraburkholderia sp. ZP32-5]|uniref:GlcG/HbpS family heme-binding protein n=1 Tax=Paraburkholderia sp. ZP32-5 TaxID=2883245 RepID=UPI001F224D76|nr:heme-binding protein [Paraburkholderia sp. ZP32-5]